MTDQVDVLANVRLGEVLAGPRLAEAEAAGSRCHFRFGAGWHCTRARGHLFRHLASINGRIEALGPVGAPVAGADPMAGVVAGTIVRSVPGSDHPEYGIRVRGPACRRDRNGRKRTTGNYCTRPDGHPETWACISCPATTVEWVGRPRKEPDVVVPAPDDPPDGTPVDTLPVMTATQPGDILRLRDRANLLYVIGNRSTGVEVLDLTRREFRTIPLPSLVPMPDANLSLEDVRWVTEWFAGQRQRTRDIAVQEYRNERWCMDGLQTELRRLGLEDYRPALTGFIQIRVPLETEDQRYTGSESILGALPTMTAEIRAAVQALIPVPEGMTLKFDEATFYTSNLHRK